MTGSSADSSPRSHMGAHPSCKICLKNTWMRPADPLVAFHLRFPTQQLMIGLLSCKREGQLLAQPTVPGSVGPNPWDHHQKGHFGGFGAHGEGQRPCVMEQLHAGRWILCWAQGHPQVWGCCWLRARGASAVFGGQLCIMQQ